MQVLGETGRAAARPQCIPLPADIRKRLSEAVAAAFGISPAELERRTRGRIDIARARQTAIYLARVVLRLTFREAGRLYGRDRSTAAHACRVVEDLRDDPGFDRLLDILEHRLSSMPGAWPARARQ